MSEIKRGFAEFCELIDDNNILKKHSVMSVVSKLQLSIEETKQEIYKELMVIDESKKDYHLDSKILTIENLNYIENYGIGKIYYILKNLDVSIEQLISFNYPHELNSTIDVVLSYDEYHDNYDYLRGTQENLLYYFLSYYAKELISFLESKKSNFNGKNIKKENLMSEAIVEAIADSFEDLKEVNHKMSKEIEASFGNDIFADHTPIELKFEYEIDFTKDKIKEFISDLYNQSKEDNYFYFDCPSDVYINHFEDRKKNYLDEVPEANEFEFLLSEVKYFSEPYDNRVIIGKSRYNYNEYVDYSDRYRITLKRKIEFLSKKLEHFGYILITNEETSLIDESTGNYKGWGTEIILEKTENKIEDIPEVEYKSEKQLTTNQIVLLLQETGFFSHPKIENASKVRQSELISRICGLNSKNIKTKIQNLDKSPKELGKNHQKDIDKIDNILNNLE